MPDVAHHVPLTFEEAVAAVRRASLNPDELPVRVVAGAVRLTAASGPSRDMVESWNIESAGGPAVGELANLVLALRTGRRLGAVAAPVRQRYDEVGVVAAAALASVLAAESMAYPIYAAPEPLGLGRGRRMGTEMLGLAEQLHRSFGVIPDRWKALSLQPRAASRWWEAHDGAMVPATLSGEEKWLAAAAFAEAVGDSRLAVLYTGFLVRQGWDRADIEAGTFGRLSRQRRGFGRALRGVKEMLIAGLDRSRVELAGADLSAEAVVELVDLARLTRSMVVVGALG